MSLVTVFTFFLFNHLQFTQHNSFPSDNLLFSWDVWPILSSLPAAHRSPIRVAAGSLPALLIYFVAWPRPLSFRNFLSHTLVPISKSRPAAGTGGNVSCPTSAERCLAAKTRFPTVPGVSWPSLLSPPPPYCCSHPSGWLRSHPRARLNPHLLRRLWTAGCMFASSARTPRARPFVSTSLWN